MEPLSPRKRKLYFVALTVVFILVVPLLLLYSIGYRLGDALSLVKTGGIFVHTERSGSIIYINDDEAKNSSFLNRSVLVQDLKPLEYNVRVERAGYTSWEKDLSVYPEFVTEARVLMVKNDLEIEPIIFMDEARSASSTYATTTRQYRNIMSRFGLYVEVSEKDESVENATSTKKDATSVRPNLEPEVAPNTLNDLEPTIGAEEAARIASAISVEIPVHTYDDYTKILELTPDQLFETDFIENRNHVLWIQNENIHVAWIGRREDTPFYFCRAMDVCKNKFVIDFNFPITQFEFMPGRDDAILLVENNKLLVTEFDDRSERTILFPLGDFNIDDFYTDGDSILILSEDVIYEVEEL